MKINWLVQEEKNRTRQIWETIFTEDSTKFLDYYYQVKNAENEVVTLEEDGKEVSMLHLNPYPMRLGRKNADSHYIVAVATDPDYRHRGYMAELLKASMQRMYEKKEPFTFLMPASEAIYLPFDFRFIYEQNQAEITGKASGKWQFREADLEDAGILASLASAILEKSCTVTAIRDEAYYKRQILEQKSENGGIRIAMDGGDPVGMFSYGYEDGSFEIMEPLANISGGWATFLKEAVFSLTADEVTPVMCRGLLEEGRRKKPIIMARIIHLETLLEALVPVCDFRMEISVFDPILKENNGVFRLTTERGRVLAEKVRDKIESVDAIPVSELTQILFGYGNEEADLLQFVKPLAPVFLNEVV